MYNSYCFLYLGFNLFPVCVPWMYASTSPCLYLDARVYGTGSNSVCNISLQYLPNWAWVSLKFLLQTASLITFVVSSFSFLSEMITRK